MRGSRPGHDPHARFRALISQRLDEPLTTEDAEQLRTHLFRCARCRGVDRDFRAQRVLLRGPARSLPPRDLWARTAAALDREVAKGRRAGVSGEPFAWRRGSPRIAAASIVGLMLVVAVIGDQLSGGGGGPIPPPQLAAGPTPFEVPTQELAFVGHEANGFAIYRTDVSRMCPAQSIDCTTLTSRNRQLVRLRGEQPDQDVRPHSVAFHPNGNKVAISATEGRGEAVYVVFLRTVPNRPIDGAAPETDWPLDPSVTPAPLLTLRPTLSPATGGTAVAATPTPVTTVRPSTPPPAGAGAPTPRPTPAATASPSPPPPTARTGPTAKVRPTGPTATVRPGPTAAATTRATEVAATGTSVPATPWSGPAATPGATVAPPGGSGPATPGPGANPADGEVIQPILEDVLPTGADPAWSPDGDTLAFSAMPADRSAGSDIYIWRNGEQHAERLTDDHRSYFASWSGGRIVASRAPRSVQAGRLLAGDSGVVTVVIDLRTGEQRRLAQRDMWLPAVDPSGRFAIVWRGDLRQVGPGIEPVAGALYAVDWGRLDPFGDGDGVGVGTMPSDAGGEPLDGGDAASASPEATAPASSGPPGETSGGSPAATSAAATSAVPTGAPATRRPRAARRTGSRSPAPTATVPQSGSPPVASPSPPATPVATPSPPELTLRPAPTEDPLLDAQPVEPERSVAREPVLDWQVRWNDDGDAFGFWIAETPGASWGRLAIVAIDRPTGRIVRGDALLGPTLARRTFSLGQDRVAWVAPVEDKPDGELRIRTWGPNGNGTLRIRDVDAGEGVAGF